MYLHTTLTQLHKKEVVDEMSSFEGLAAESPGVGLDGRFNSEVILF